MLNKNVEEALNAQINAEMWSAYLYFSMAAYCHSVGRDGTAGWFETQSKEEQDHARILYNYIVSRDGRVTLAPITGVPVKWDSPLKAFEESLENERKVTMLINDLCDLAREENDHATRNMLQWFVDEQVEEEKTVKDIIEGMRLIGGDGYGQYMLDKELGARTYTPAAPLADK